MRKFELPKEFKVRVSESEIEIVIPEHNPIWIGFYIILTLGSAFLAYVAGGLFLLGVLLLPILILVQLSKKTVCLLNRSGFTIQKERFEYDDIESVIRSTKDYEIGSLANRGEVSFKKK